MKTRVALIILAILALPLGLAIGGCGGVDSIGQHKEYVIQKEVGTRTIDCIEVRTSHGAGISCDWGSH